MLEKEVADEAEAETLVEVVEGWLAAYPTVKVSANVTQEITTD